MSANVEPILSFVRRRLDEVRGHWVEVSRESGVPYHTLTKIAQGQVPDPRISTVQRLVDYFNGVQGGDDSCQSGLSEREVADAA
jgi:predicted transcriptional regulator